MARINYDDGLETLPFFKKLARILKDEDKARGMLIRLWRLGQKYWADGKQCIPVEWFEFEDLRPTMDAGFCEMTERGVYVKGSEEHFAWLLEKKEAARRGGRTRAAAPRDEHGKFYSSRDGQPAPSHSASQSPAIAGSVAGVLPAASSHETTPLAPALAPAPVLALVNVRSSAGPQAGPPEDSDRPSPEWLAKTWNERCGPLRKLNDPFMLNSERRLKALDRIREKPRKALWIEAIDRMAKSPFCQGKKSSKPDFKGWKADFDFLLSNIDGALEGKYDDPDALKPAPSVYRPRPETPRNPDAAKHADEALRTLKRGPQQHLEPEKRTPDEIRDEITRSLGLGLSAEMEEA